MVFDKELDENLVCKCEHIFASARERIHPWSRRAPGGKWTQT
jgi:hypothetical protein